jgi:hypothetical protein
MGGSTNRFEAVESWVPVDIHTPWETLRRHTEDSAMAGKSDSANWSAFRRPHQPGFSQGCFHVKIKAVEDANSENWFQ